MLVSGKAKKNTAYGTRKVGQTTPLEGFQELRCLIWNFIRESLSGQMISNFAQIKPAKKSDLEWGCHVNLRPSSYELLRILLSWLMVGVYIQIPN